MTLSAVFRRFFQGATLEIDDLFLLESFQVALLPGYAPEPELGAVLNARPEIARFLVARCPEVAGFIDTVVAEHRGQNDPSRVAACGDELVWSIADLLVYNKCPDVYDGLPFHAWDFGEVTSLVDMRGKTVIDSGAGTGRVALEAAGIAATFYALKPISRLRQFIRAKARDRGIGNLYVVDGFNDSLSFPDSFAGVLITSHALGWSLEADLREFERVVHSPGIIFTQPSPSDRRLIDRAPGLSPRMSGRRGQRLRSAPPYGGEPRQL